MIHARLTKNVLALAVLLSACGDGKGTTDAAAGSDAGARDGGHAIDAGRDGGHAIDAGRDGGHAIDAGALGDAGTDAGAISDAGPPPNGGDTCEAALDVTAGGTFAAQTTAGASDDYDPSGDGCPFALASDRDIAYRLAPATTTTYVVTVTPTTSSFDPMLYAVSACGGDGCLAGTRLNGPGEQEQITLTVEGGATAFIVVDGEPGTSAGELELEVAIP